jgi:hypothetical protein
MRNIAVALLLSSAASKACLISSEPSIVAKSTAVADSSIVGRWVEAVDSQKADRDTITIVRDTSAPANEPRYVYLVEERNGPGRYDLRLTRISGALFGELTPFESDMPFGAAPTHFFFRIDWSGPQLTVRAMEPDWLTKYVAQHPGRVQTVTRGDWIVIRGSTASTRQFLASTRDAPGAYSSPTGYHRVR